MTKKSVVSFSQQDTGGYSLLENIADAPAIVKALEQKWDTKVSLASESENIFCYLDEYLKPDIK